MTLYKTIAGKNGGTRVAMTADEEVEFLAEQATAQEVVVEPSEIEIRLAALEEKAGITAEDKDAAKAALISNVGTI